MPIYEYVCNNCGHRMEVMHGVHDRGPASCAVCGGQVRKAFSAPAVVFKGTGWAKKERVSAPSRHKPKDHAREASSEAAATEGSTSTASSDKASGGSSPD